MRHIGAVVLLGLICGIAGAQGRIDIKVRGAGFQAPLDVERFMGRDGQWLPVHLELTYNGPQPIQGEVVIEATDLDGDIVGYVESPVALTPNGGIKHVWCYVTTSLPTRGEVRASFISDGVRQASAVLPALGGLPNRKHLVLDISDSALVKLRGLSLQSEQITDSSLGLPRPFTVECVVASLQSAELPDRWFGLEAVDTIVWDDPDPAKLSDAQIDALKAWVRNGGKLVVGIGSSWQKVQRSALLEMLPFKGDETTVTTRVAPQSLLEFITGRPAKAGNFKRDVQVVTVTRDSPGTRMCWAIIPGAPKPVSMFSYRFYGSGRVIAAATSLRELFDLAPNPASLAERIFDVTPVRDAFLKSEGAQAYSFASGITKPTSVYDAVVGPTQFRGVSNTLWIGALLFVMFYGGVAALSYFYLVRRGMAHLSWTVFAGFAVFGSVISLATVGASRGFYRGVSSTAIIDIDFNTPNARGPMWFGYSSATRQFSEMSLPGEGNYLRPLTARPTDLQTYATPLRYEAVTGKAKLEHTPIRATLKQFEGYWNGALSGTIRGELSVSRRTGYLTTGSWLRNDLPVNLTSGVLLYLDPRPRELPIRATDYPAGRLPRLGDSLPGDAVIVAQVPDLAPGGQAKGWLEREYAKLEADVLKAQGDKSLPRPNLPTLADLQAEWNGRTNLLPASVKSDPAATLLMSTRSLQVPAAVGSPEIYRVDLSADYSSVVMRDVSHWLTRGNAVLLVFSPTPAPASLRRNGEALEARDGYTLYRVRIPIQYTEGPADESDAPDTSAPDAAAPASAPSGATGETP